MQTKGLQLLESLTQAHSVPGYEDEVRKIFLDELDGHGAFGADTVSYTHLTLPTSDLV